MKMLEGSGKTVAEAITNAVSQLGLTADDVDVTVLDEGSKGFWGFGAKPARVLVTEKLRRVELEANKTKAAPTQTSAAPPARAARPVPERKPSAEVPKQPAAKPAEHPMPRPVAAKPQSVPTPRPAAEVLESAQSVPTPRPVTEPSAKSPQPAKPQSVSKPQNAQPRRRPNPQPAVPAQPVKARAPISGESTALSTEAKEYLDGMLSLMDLTVDVTALQNDEAVMMEAAGPDAGTLIGYRGETLDALQYLVSLKINKGEDGYHRVTLDAENYRAKREDTLIKLANRLANKAAKTGRKVALEPMNPYERRILHSALQNNAKVKTHSEGEEPYRRVVITPKKV